MNSFVKKELIYICYYVWLVEQMFLLTCNLNILGITSEFRKILTIYIYIVIPNPYFQQNNQQMIDSE